MAEIQIDLGIALKSCIAAATWPLAAFGEFTSNKLLEDDTRSPSPLADLSRTFSTSETMQKFLTTAPVVAAITNTLTAGILIEWNRFFPDLLFHPM